MADAHMVLRRSTGDEIVIGNPPDLIRIKFYHVGNGRARVGVVCDRSLPIWRGEYLSQIEAAAAEAEEAEDVVSP